MDRPYTNAIRAFMRAPMLRATVPFVVGLVMARYWPVPWPWAWGAAVASAAVWAYVSFRRQKYAQRAWTGISFVVVWMVMGLLWQALHQITARPDHLGHLSHKATGWALRVAEPPVRGARTLRVWADVVAVRSGHAWGSAQGKVLLTLMADSMRSAPQRGEVVLLQAPLEPIARQPDPGGFDLRQWAAGKGVYHQAFAPAENWKRMGSGAPRPGFFEKAREQIHQWLRASGLPDRERALVKALLLGQRDEMDSGQTQAFVRSGTIHVLAVSGTHVGIIYMAVIWALVFLGKETRGRILRGVLALTALWCYAGLTGFVPSVLRATVMFSLFTVAEMARWRTESLNSLATAAFFLLLWEPAMLYQLSFQLSFLAVLGIVVLYRPIHDLWSPYNPVLSFFWSLASVSIAAQTFTLPLCLYVFQAFPVWFLPANMAIVGLVAFGVYGGILLLATHAIPVLGPLIAFLLKWLLMLLGFLSAFFAWLPGAYPALRVGFWGMVGLYALITVLAFWLVQHARWARSATLAVLAMLLFGWAHTARERNAQRVFALYQQREGVTCAFVQGRTMHVFTTVGGSRVDASIAAHARAAGVRTVVRADSLPVYVRQGSVALAFHSGQQLASLAARDTAAFVVVHGPGDARPPGSPVGRHWLLASDLNGRTRSRLSKQAMEWSLPVHDLRVQGAYVGP